MNNHKKIQDIIQNIEDFNIKNEGHDIDKEIVIWHSTHNIENIIEEKSILPFKENFYQNIKKENHFL